MAFILADLVRQSTLTTGVGPFTLTASIPGYRDFADVMEVDDSTWGTIREPGTGKFVSGQLTLSDTDEISITDIFESSNDGGPVSFGVGTKDVFIGLPASQATQLNAPKGTRILFQQSVCPTGWTKDTTHNDKSLRIVSGTVGSGGTNNFSTVMAQTVVGSTTLSASQVPAHTHTGSGTTSGQSNGHTHTVTRQSFSPNNFTTGGGGIPVDVTSFGSDTSFQSGGASADHTHTYSFTTSSHGGGGSHNHSIVMDLKFVDAVIGVKE